MNKNLIKKKTRVEISNIHVTFINVEDNINTNVLQINRARGIFYLSTNAHKPYARGLPVKNQRRTNRKQSSSHQY